MELAATIEPFNSPAGAFLTTTDNEFFRTCQEEYEERVIDNLSEARWKSSVMNPGNRLNAFYPAMKPDWRIDGCSALGRQFFVIPSVLLPDVPVKYINVLVPCQSRQPRGLRRVLQSSHLYGLSGQHANAFKISQYLVQALTCWSSHLPQFDDIYRSLPFGSRIVLESLSLDIQDVIIRLIPNIWFDRSLLSAIYLQGLWDLDHRSWPAKIALLDLQHVAQLNGNVSVVRIPKLHGLKTFIFKTNLRSIKYIYHELKLLLSMEAHSNIISRPHFLVTIDEDAASPSAKIVGFILEHYSSGTLRDFLDSGTVITPQLQIKWAIQIARTLYDIMASPAGFFSDLKPDNLIISHPNADVIFIDFEQAGNWDTFSAPEIFYVEWMKKLSDLECVPEARKKRYKDLLQTNIPNQTPKQEVYSNPSKGYYDAWTSLQKPEQEAAMVFSLGKMLWCIFEKSSHTQNSTDEKYNQQVIIEFPNFSQTPHRLRQLIQRCTAGAPEHRTQEDVRIVREGSVFYPRLAMETDFERGETSPQKTMDATKLLWMSRVQKMEVYVEAKTRFVRAVHDDNDVFLLGFPLRPRLIEVLAILHSIK